MAERVLAGPAANVPVGGVIVVDVRGKDVAVFNVEGTFHAIDDLCPHMAASLSGGFVENGVVTCPWHYWQFRLCDGAWVDNPRIRTGSYIVHVVDGELQIESPALPTG